MSDSVRPHRQQPTRLPSPWDSLGKNTGVGSLSLLQGISPTQGSNPGLPHCRWILYQLSHKGNSRILEWVAYSSTVDLPDPGIELGSPALRSRKCAYQAPASTSLAFFGILFDGRTNGVSLKFSLGVTYQARKYLLPETRANRKVPTKAPIVRKAK